MPPPPPPPPVMLIVEMPATGAVIVEMPAPLKSNKVTPYPTFPPAVLIPTPEITPVSAEPSIAGRAPVNWRGYIS